ncbi:MAG: TldD/PmbA family protein [candidate division WOR-3 bacterium]|nr:TldD/PmbA family protein [candidate division WOR-3 bacterium]
MEELIKKAESQSDQAEVYSLEHQQNDVEFEDGILKDIKSAMQAGITLRMIQNKKLGFAYTRNIKDKETLIQNAKRALAGGVDASYDFPFTKKVSSLDSYDPAIDRTTSTILADECSRIHDYLKNKTEGQVNVDTGTAVTRIHIVNSAGTDLKTQSSHYYITVAIMYPGSATSVHRSLEFKSFKKVEYSFLDNLVKLYSKSEREIDKAHGRMKILFMPEAMYTLTWRLQSATSGESLYHKQSPLADSLESKIFDEKISIINNPLDDEYPGARAFDDEGVESREMVIIDKGTLRNYYNDLYYAAKLQAEPTGNGYKTSRWGSDTLSTKPAPALSHIMIKPGNTEFWQLVEKIDRGIVVCGALGADSGNISNGDFSIGPSPGLYVEKGEIVGRIKDAMIAGNLYSVMKRVVDIENQLHPAYTGYYPAVLFDEMHIATKT